MITVFKERPSIVVEAQKAHFKPHFLIQTLLFLVVFLVSQFLMTLPAGIYTVVLMVRDILEGNLTLGSNEPPPEYMAALANDLVLISLFLTVIATIVVIVYCKFIEKRSLFSMGFVKKKAFSDYLRGAGLGILMIGLSLLISLLFGTVTYEGFVLGDGLGLLFLFLLGFLLQGMSEEVMLRGYFMVSVAAKNSLLLAVIINSVLFAFMHILNNGIDVLPLINLTLFGVFASIYTLKMNSIWGICALHSIWNFAQGNLFGIKVSGIDTQVSVFSFNLKDSGALINGGSFGLEGGLAVTIVLVIGTIVLLSIKGRGLNKELADASDANINIDIIEEVI